MFYGSPLSERLHQATRLPHRRLERRVDVHCTNFDIHDYRRLLQDFWGFYQPLERKLIVLADGSLPSPYSLQPRKAPCLRQDLLSLGMTDAGIAGLPLCGRLPAITALPQALGVLYVIGSCMVSGRIAGIAGNPSHGGSFFASYGQPVDQYWKDLNRALTSTVDEPDLQMLEMLAIEAAVDTFDCFEAWVDYRHRSRRANYLQWNAESQSTLFGAQSFDRDSISGAA